MKFCISTGRWIAYERWVNAKGESITIEKMEKYILQPDQVVDVLFAPNA